MNVEKQPNSSSNGWFVSLYKELYALFWNLTCGINILLFRGRAFDRVVVTYDQLFLLILFYAITLLCGSYFLFVDPQFTVWGLGYLGADLLITLLGGYIVAKAARERSRLPLFMVVSYSITPVIYIISNILLRDASADSRMLIFAWVVAVMFFIAYALLDKHKFKAVVVTALLFVISLPMTQMTPGFWYEGYINEDASFDAYESIDAEKVYYSQYDLLDNALGPIYPEVDGVDDLYFVGFGSYASQDVFMREIGHIQEFANTKLGTRNRSVALINNQKTINDIPLASSTNLDITLSHLGKIMNPEEDVLFLYLTSHGSKNHELSVDMYPLGLNDITPQELKRQLDDSGIRWRIILVSACYSGGFIEPLRDESTLIMTAAASDKTSFGCSNKNEYTYFGEALFKESPEMPYRFVNEFEKAIASIKKREKDEGKDPSDPQMYVGSLIRDKLHSLEDEMVHYSSERFQ